MEWAPVYHIKGWGKFNRNYGDFCTGADRAETEVAATRDDEALVVEGMSYRVIPDRC